MTNRAIRIEQQQHEEFLQRQLQHPFRPQHQPQRLRQRQELHSHEKSKN